MPLGGHPQVKGKKESSRNTRTMIAEIEQGEMDLTWRGAQAIAKDKTSGGETSFWPYVCHTENYPYQYQLHH